MKKIEKIYSNVNSINFHKIKIIRKFVNMSERVFLTEQEKIKIILHNFYSSFMARYQVCLSKNGQSLKGSWTTVHHLHGT